MFILEHCAQYWIETLRYYTTKYEILTFVSITLSWLKTTHESCIVKLYSIHKDTISCCLRGLKILISSKQKFSYYFVYELCINFYFYAVAHENLGILIT